MSRRIRHSCAAVGLLLTCLTFGASAADRDVWNHPDPRFAAIDELVDDDDFAGAQKMIAELRAEAKRTKDQVLLAETLEQGKEVTKLARDFEKVRKHLKTLENSPNDPKASLAVGKYYCVVKGNWQRGLPLLAAGDDAKLAALAADDNSDVLQTDDQIELADRWWQYAQKVSDAGERIAFQLHVRDWMIKARPRATDKQRATIDQRLSQIPLFIERVVVWNTHNGDGNDRGAQELLVSLLFQDTVVWKEAVAIPWTANKPAYVMLRPKHIRADQVRVDITKHLEHGGGLGEIEVAVGRKNIASTGKAVADAYFEFKEQYAPSRLVDGDTSGNTGFWLAEDRKAGSASIHFVQLASEK